MESKTTMNEIAENAIKLINEIISNKDKKNLLFMKKKLDLKYLESHLCYLGCDFKKINTKKIKKTDLKKAYNILKSIEKNINIANENEVWILSSKFYEIIPIDFSYK